MTPEMIAQATPTPAPGVGPSSAASALLGSGVASTDQHPSTEGFLQVLDALLSTPSMMPSAGGTTVSNLLVQTSVTATMPKPVPDDGSQVDGEGDSDPALDPKLCSDIASLLQTLGFQVRPEQIAELSPLDRQQLDSALEFVGRNLQRGVSASDVSECAALLLPRPWPLDDSDGTPRTQATAVAGQDASKLPDGFGPALEQVRTELHAVVVSQVRSEPVAPKPYAHPADLAVAQAQISPEAAPLLASAVAAAAKTASGREHPQDPQADPQILPQSPPPQLGSQFQPQDPVVVATDIHTRHLPPGSPASELIGRQILEKVQVQLSEGRRELSLRLWPEELGEVHLSLRMAESDRVTAHIVVENDAVRQAMLDSMPQLREALVRHGLDLEKMSVSVGHTSADSTGSGAGAGADGDGHDDRSGRGGGRRGGFQNQEVLVAMPLVLGQDTGRRNGRNTFDMWS